ncbi:MAG: hypothetical protein PHX87_01445 [Candidatus Peribacteraceae bacterium]|nr:hypothetical protein [Candidatus Peribacteraceae bacterium]MDD5742073.1 hypothetical protein [Candidatus Peribacteraceae bacterium]
MDSQQEQETQRWREIIERLKAQCGELPDPLVQKLAKQTVDFLNAAYSARIANIMTTIAGERAKVAKAATIDNFVRQARQLTDLLEHIAHPSQAGESGEDHQ